MTLKKQCCHQWVNAPSQRGKVFDLNSVSKLLYKNEHWFEVTVISFFGPKTDKKRRGGWTTLDVFILSF